VFARSCAYRDKEETACGVFAFFVHEYIDFEGNIAIEVSKILHKHQVQSLLKVDDKPCKLY
jgi:hypothetical protein